mgnify:CR=1 FL=1
MERDLDHGDIGLESAATLALVNNLGSALRQQGKTEEAAPFYERGYQAQLRLHGPGHTSTLIAFNNLARLRVDQGRAGEILDALRQNVADGVRAAAVAVAITDERFGADLDGMPRHERPSNGAATAGTPSKTPSASSKKTARQRTLFSLSATEWAFLP